MWSREGTFRNEEIKCPASMGACSVRMPIMHVGEDINQAKREIVSNLGNRTLKCLTDSRKLPSLESLRPRPSLSAHKVNPIMNTSDPAWRASSLTNNKSNREGHQSKDGLSPAQGRRVVNLAKKRGCPAIGNYISPWWLGLGYDRAQGVFPTQLNDPNSDQLKELYSDPLKETFRSSFKELLRPNSRRWTPIW